MKNKIVAILVFSLFVVSFFAGQWLRERDSSKVPVFSRSMYYQSCNPSIKTCAAYLGRHKVSLKFLQAPSALKPFQVLLKTGDLRPESVQVEFFMPEMDMGVNLFTLSPQADGIWQAQALLPVCSLGRNDWTVRLHVLYQGEVHRADFNFMLSKN